MELLSVLRILLRRWWLVLIPVAVTASLAVPALLRPGTASGGYTAGLQYTAFQSISAILRTDGDYQDLWLSSELTINAFTDWVQSGSFKQEIAAQLDANFNPAALGISADNARSLGTITFSYPEQGTLDAAVRAAIVVLQTRTQDYYAQLGGVPAEVTILDQSPATFAAPPLTDRFGPFLRIGLGLLAGIGLALLAHYLDPVVHRREEIETLGLPVIAAIPKL